MVERGVAGSIDAGHPRRQGSSCSLHLARGAGRANNGSHVGRGLDRDGDGRVRWCRAGDARLHRCSLSAAESTSPPAVPTTREAVPSHEVTLNYVAPTPDSAYAGSVWGGNKVLWAVAPSVRSAVLVRGRALNGQVRARFGQALDPAKSLVLPAPPPGSASRRASAEASLARLPGDDAFEARRVLRLSDRHAVVVDSDRVQSMLTRDPECLRNGTRQRSRPGPTIVVLSAPL